MRRLKSIVIAILMSTLMILPASLAWAGPIDLTPNVITPIITPVNPVTPLFVSSHEVIRSIPLHRGVVAAQSSGSYGCHFYTANEIVFNSMMKASYYWADDGIVGYISPVPLPYTLPLWKLQKINGVDQFLVYNQTSHDTMTLLYGYMDSGIIGYVADLNDASHGNAKIYQCYKGTMNQGPATNDNWNNDHFFSSDTMIPDGYQYEGPKFKAWSGASTLQEVNVMAPNGGETLTGGTKVNITWNTMIPGGNINLFYTLDPSAGWSVIAKDLPNNGTYNWTVPNSTSTKAIVEARWTYNGIDGNCFDQSDKYFTINAGSGPSINWQLFSPLKLDVLLGPATPTNLSVNSYPGQEQPLLGWQDNATSETGYVIERKTSGGSYAKLAQISANKTNYTDNSAAKGITYYYRVKAINGNSSSGYSNEAAGSVYTEYKISPPTPPAPPIPPAPQPGGQVGMLFTLNQNTYLVNGVIKTMDVSPVTLEGRTVLPIRFAADPIGALTEWNGNENKVTVTLGSTKLELWIGSNLALINGVGTLIDPNNPEVKPIIMNDRTMLPMRFVTEKLGCSVEWLPATSQIKVQYPAS